MDPIAFTKVALPYGWLGNMAPYPLTYGGKEWRTSEALFQALRFTDESIQEDIRSQTSPMAAKMVARQVIATLPDQVAVQPQGIEDLKNMHMVLKLKLEQHPHLRDELLATGDRLIIEDCTKRTRGSGLFWGARLLEDGTWDGKNYLGRMWVSIRDSLREGSR